MNSEPVWIHPAAVNAVHWDQIEKFGGLAGTRDGGMLEFALGRPQNLSHYESPDVYRLAAAYAFGIAKNHPFVDRNIRTAFVVSVLFLELKGREFNASEPEAAEMFIALAAGEVGEDSLAEWFEEHSTAK